MVESPLGIEPQNAQRATEVVREVRFPLTSLTLRLAGTPALWMIESNSKMWVMTSPNGVEDSRQSLIPFPPRRTRVPLCGDQRFVDLRTRPPRGYNSRGAERWLSGRKRPPAKWVGVEGPLSGSNPDLSAIKFLFVQLTAIHWLSCRFVSTQFSPHG